MPEYGFSLTSFSLYKVRNYDNIRKIHILEYFTQYEATSEALFRGILGILLNR